MPVDHSLVEAQRFGPPVPMPDALVCGDTPWHELSQSDQDRIFGLTRYIAGGTLNNVVIIDFADSKSVQGDEDR